jgi:hypothetical protein
MIGLMENVERHVNHSGDDQVLEEDVMLAPEVLNSA